MQVYTDIGCVGAICYGSWEESEVSASGYRISDNVRRNVPSQLLAQQHIKDDIIGEPMEKNEEVMTVDNIRNHVYFIRGQQVMLD